MCDISNCIEIQKHLSFEECVKDSPRFRTALHTAESDLERLRVGFESAKTTCSQLVSAGAGFALAGGRFGNALQALVEMYVDNEKVSAAINKMSKMVCQMEELLGEFVASLRQVQSRFESIEVSSDARTPCMEFVVRDKRIFTRCSEELDSVLTKSMSQAKATHEIDKLTAQCRSNFLISSFNYVQQIRALANYKNVHILETLSHYIHAEEKFFKQGTDFVRDTQPWRSFAEQALENVREQGATEMIRLTTSRVAVEARHRRDELSSPSLATTATQENVESYVFLRTSKKWKPWVRRWLFVQDNQLWYSKRGETTATLLESDLRICTAREVVAEGRRNCFELIAPGRVHLLQAENSSELQQWIRTLQCGMNNSCTLSRSHVQRTTNSQTELSSRDGLVVDPGDSRSAAEKRQRYEELKRHAIQLIQAVEGNESCADCGAASPRWASVSFGVLLCIECSGVHRSFGVHISKVRSLTLDSWEPFLLKVMLTLGNRRVNNVFEGGALNDEDLLRELQLQRATPDSSAEERRRWLSAKWLDKKFVRCGQALMEEADDLVATSTDPNLLLYHAARLRNLPLAMEALTLQADPNWRNELDGGCTALVKAIESGSLATCEFLLMHGAQLNAVDNQGRTALHHAAALQHTRQVCLLLKRGASQSHLDCHGRSAYDVALGTSNADIVTLLRLSELNAEVREREGLLRDDTYHDVFQDFIQMAFDDDCADRRDQQHQQLTDEVATVPSKSLSAVQDTTTVL